MTEQEPNADVAITIPRGGGLHQFVLETSRRRDIRRPWIKSASASPSRRSKRPMPWWRSWSEPDRSTATPETARSRTPIHSPTSQHRTRVRLAGGPEVFAMCAIDALGMPFMLRRDVDIASACAGCGVEVRVEVRGGRVGAHAPSDVTVWFGDTSEGCVAATDLCPDLNFFCSPACREGWNRTHPEKRGMGLGLEDAVSRGRRVFEDLLYANDDG